MRWRAPPPRRAAPRLCGATTAPARAGGRLHAKASPVADGETSPRRPPRPPLRRPPVAPPRRRATMSRSRSPSSNRRRRPEPALRRRRCPRRQAPTRSKARTHIPWACAATAARALEPTLEDKIRRTRLTVRGRRSSCAASRRPAATFAATRRHGLVCSAVTLPTPPLFFRELPHFTTSSSHSPPPRPSFSFPRALSLTNYTSQYAAAATASPRAPPPETRRPQRTKTRPP